METWIKITLAMSLAALIVSASLGAYLVLTFSAFSQEMNSELEKQEFFLERLREAAGISEKGFETLEKAWSEKELVLYTVWDTASTQSIVDKFKSIYPWAQVSFVAGLSSGTIGERFALERSTNTPTADMMFLTQSWVSTFKEQGLIANYTPPSAALYQPGQHDPLGYYHVYQYAPLVVMYNTGLVTSEELPSTWEELADPKWTGSIAFDPPQALGVSGVVFSGLRGYLENDTKWNNWLNDIAALEPVLFSSATSAYQAMISGEYKIVITSFTDYTKQAPGTPAQVLWLNPVFAINVVAVINGNAAHPYMARLFLDWFLSESGMTALSETGRIPSLLTLDVPISLGRVLPTGVTLAQASYLEPMYEDPDYYKTIYTGLFD